VHVRVGSAEHPAPGQPDDLVDAVEHRALRTEARLPVDLVEADLVVATILVAMNDLRLYLRDPLAVELDESSLR